MSGQSQSTLYHWYFSETFGRRMRYVNKICFLQAVVVSVLLRLPYGHFWRNWVESCFRVPVLFVVFLLVKEVRVKGSKVDFSAAKSVAEQTLVSVFSLGFLGSWVLFLVSAMAMYAVFLAQLPLFANYYVLAKEFRIKPPANDAWVYFWFHAFFCASMYAVQHAVFQRQRLSVGYGTAKARPETVLFNKTAYLLGLALFFTVFCTVASPFTYIFARGFVYRIIWPFLVLFKLDTAMPPLRIGLSTLSNVSFASWLMFLSWEIVDHVYNTYATIGCIDGKTAVSAHSANPVATLLAGLRDVTPDHTLAQATAFQELAYVASAKDAYCEKTRNAIFNTPSRGSPVWPAILAECALVINATASRINFRLDADMAALKRAAAYPEDEPSGIHTPAQENTPIFGNSHDTTAASDTTAFAVSATLSPLKPQAQTSILNTQVPLKIWVVVATLWAPLERAFAGFYAPSAARHRAQLHAQTVAGKSAVARLHTQFLASPLGVFFRTTAKRDAEARVRNPSLYANAVLALSGFLTHAVEEDRANSVSSSHISEVLNLLERPIRASANYTDVLPASVYTPLPKPNANHHLVAYMHDLTMAEYFHLCVKYNYKLNDLLLSPRAFKLAKWVIDASIAQQQKQETSQMATYL